MLTLEDPQRFVKSRDVGPYLGLVPKQKDSGDSQPQLRITGVQIRRLRDPDVPNQFALATQAGQFYPSSRPLASGRHRVRGVGRRRDAANSSVRKLGLEISGV